MPGLSCAGLFFKQGKGLKRLMRIIGCTGSIACGKSTVSSYLTSRGFPVVDGDRLSREIMVPGNPVLAEIRKAFGPEVFYEDSSLNRRRLGQIVFRDSEARKTLDNIMAPYLFSATRQHIENIRASGAVLCFLDMPLLFEKGYDRLCDSVWTVWLPQETQLARLMERDGFSREEATSRMNAVLSSDEKASRSTYVIDNSGSVEHTYDIVDHLLQLELQQAQDRPRQRRSAPEAVASSPYPSAPVSAPLSHSSPDVMERPKAARSSHKSGRKTTWRLPVWLMLSLIVSVVLLLSGITAYWLMQGYLRQCSDRHISEQRNIDINYPLLYRDLIERYASEYNLSPAFVSAVIRNESSFRPREESGVGARGLMQLMPDTAEWIAGKLKISGFAFERMYDPESNIQFGCWYLNYLSKLYLGDPVAVTASYHAGQGQVKVWISDPLLSEDGFSLPLSSLPEGPTKNYTGRVLRDYGIYQEKYFSHPEASDSPGSSDNTAVFILRGSSR